VEYFLLLQLLYNFVLHLLLQNPQNLLMYILEIVLLHRPLK
jgi:hypothetical protein